MAQTVNDVMHRGVVACNVASTAAEMAKIMHDNHVAALVVRDERGDACGIVTKTDMVACFGKDLSSITADDIMSTSLVTVSPGALLSEAVQQMMAHKVHQLVIVTEGGVHHRPVAILTSADIVKMMVEAD